MTEIRRGKWNGLVTYRAFIDGKPVGPLQAKRSHAQRDIEEAARQALLRRPHPADGLGEVFTMDEFSQSIRQ